MAKGKKRSAEREERVSLRRLMVANAVGFSALVITVIITLAALGLLPSIFTFFSKWYDIF